MQDDSGGRLDLNLLAIFDAVMSEGSLTKAGQRLGMTQSAVSHALARLREVTGDPLFERTGRGVRATPAAQAMYEKVRNALDVLRASVRSPCGIFSPESDDRTFVLDLPVGIDTVIAPALARRLSAGCRLRFRISGGRAGGLLSELRLGESWLALDYEIPDALGFRAERIIDDPFVLIARKGHPAFGKDAVTLEQFQMLPQVALTWSQERGPSPLTERLGALGIVRKVAFSVPSYSTVPALVEATDLVAALPRRLARQYQTHYGIELHSLPDVVPPMPVYMVWHESFDGDEGHTWLRHLLREVCEGL
jgi:LysR family transcriptional activator for leuABCD operon